MKKLILVAMWITLSNIVSIQAQKTRFPVWTFHSQNTNIYGLSVGIAPEDAQKELEGSTNTFGIRLQTFPLAPFYFLAPKSPISTSDNEYYKTLNGSLGQNIYGLNISTGTFEPVDAYGISLTGFLHYSRKNNGLALAGLSNYIEKGNGVFLAAGGNDIYRGNGLMVSSVWGNGAKYFNGIQISGENHIAGKGCGLQIGVFNKAKNYRGIQIGLWNVNDKRKLPIVNWQFKG